MKFIATLSEIEKLLRNHYDLPQGTQIVITRPRKRKAKADDQIKTLTVVPKSVLSQSNFDFIAQVEEALRQGRLIEAIKAYRTKTNAGLKDAKDCVENWPNTRKYIERYNNAPMYYSAVYEFIYGNKG